MSERKRKIILPNGNEPEGSEVNVAQATEKWSEFVLDDGTVLFTKAIAASFFKVEGRTDKQGRPIYLGILRCVCENRSMADALK
jgi:hypothetical protein